MSATATTRVAIEAGLPLSFAQERIWFVEQLNPGTPAFTVSARLHAAGCLNADALRAALRGLVARHEILRTRFRPGIAGPVQDVLAEVEVPFDVVDLTVHSGTSGADLAALLDAHRNDRFDLSQAPLLRARLVRVAPDGSVLLIGMHHIVCDGASADILLRDLTELYRAAVRQTEPELPELPVQYADYAAWQRDTIDEKVMARQRDHWRDELRGVAGRLDLPTDRPRSAAGDLGGALVHRTLDADRSAALLDVARRERVTPFMLMLAAYEIVLSRTSGQADFCVGTAVTGRTHAELSDVLGCFLNLLAIRSDTTGDPTLRALLSRVRQRCLRAYANADIPFERLVTELVSDVDRSHSPLFEVLLAVQDGRSTSFAAEGVVLTPELVAVDAAQYDLALDIQIDSGGASLSLCYATGLFDAATAELFLGRLDTVLTAFTADLDRPLSALELGPVTAPIAGAERPEWLADSGLDVVGTALVRDPDRIAVRGSDQEWSGGRLWRSAGAVADRLRASGLPAGATAAVDGPDGPARLVACLGVWLAGGCAAMLDPSSPQRWRARESAAVAAVTVVTDVPSPVPAAPTPAPAVAGPDPDGPAIAAAVIADGSGRLAARRLTGRAVGSTLRALTAAWDLSPADVVLFPDAGSVLEPLAAVAAGSAVVFADVADGAVLAATGATAAYLPAAAWAAVVEQGWSAPPGFRAICPSPPTAAVRDGLLGAGARLLVLVGATEPGAWYATGSVNADRRLDLVPLPNLGIEIRDGSGARSLPAALGELVLFGPAAPMAADATGYPTGDLVRAGDGVPSPIVRRADGAPVRAGRVVCPVEIDTVLATLPGVVDAATVVDGGLVIAGCTPSTVDTAGVLAAVREQLPAFLGPDRIIALDRLPRRSDGGVDRAAVAVLSAADAVDGDGARPRVAPRNRVEQAILDCFARCLERGDLGIHDDFFAAGGTSLAAARLTGALAEAIGVSVPLKLLFTHPTVAGLATALSTMDGLGGSAVEQAELDQILPPEITPRGTRTGPARHAFVTGGTGFLGSHLVGALLEAGFPEVTCLVRGEDEDDSTARLRTELARYGVHAHLDRVRVVRGDLGEPRFGLDDAAFAALADAVDVIYHSGGHLNFVRPYRNLYAPNVLGTREVLRLACLGRPTPVHHISTFDARSGSRLVEEAVAVGMGTDDGYVLSKKVAEHLVLAAGERGLPIGVYRPWTITGDTASGAVNLSDQLTLCLAGTLLTRMAPDETPFPLRTLPVNVLARTVVELSRTTDAARPIHHLFNQRAIAMPQVLRYLQELGYPVTPVPFDQWRVQVARRTAGQLDGLTALLAAAGQPGAAPEVIETVNTERRLGRAPAWPELDLEYLRRIVDYLVASGVVPAAPAVVSAAGVG